MASFFSNGKSKMQKSITLVIDNDVVDRYTKHYFKHHPRARKNPIADPYHPSINSWMIMRRPMMNALKGRWKDFIVWFIEDQGYTNLRIENCEMLFTTYFKTNRKHDVDNTVPKFILDGFSESGFIVDDNETCLKQLTLRCGRDKENPRTVIVVDILD